ncbi:MAG: IS4 family transposase [Boseongicola sp. SB0677_bin_26]|nr:IS4 family transposase [Boseongicola sp. SB0677_bin_26]
MARTAATFTGGTRLSDYLSVSVIARVYPREAVRAALRSLGRDSRRRRDLPAEVMVYYVIAMALFRTVSAREVLRCLVDGLRWISPDLPVRVSGKSSISRARTRLGAAPFLALRDSCVAPLARPGTPGAWYRGLRLVAFDGSSLNLPDEARNREAFGLPGSPRGSSAFPQARVTAMVELGTHAAFAWHAGPLAESEAEQAERLLGHLSSGMLVLADRYYTGFPLWSRAAATGADLLWRFKGNMKFPVVEALDDGSWRSVIRGSGRDRRRSRGELPVRIVAYRIEGGGEATMLATTLLDHRAAPAAELAALYHERWEIETDCDEVKTHILGPGAALRSKTPDLVYQEIDGLMLAHYAVRRLIHEAAEKAGEDPDRLSFVHAVRVMRRRIINPGAFPPRGPAGRRD